MLTLAVYVSSLRGIAGVVVYSVACNDLMSTVNVKQRFIADALLRGLPGVGPRYTTVCDCHDFDLNE